MVCSGIHRYRRHYRFVHMNAPFVFVVHIQANQKPALPFDLVTSQVGMSTLMSPVGRSEELLCREAAMFG